MTENRANRTHVPFSIEHGLPPDYVDFLRAVPAMPESTEAQRFRASIDEFLRRR